MPEPLVGPLQECAACCDGEADLDRTLAALSALADAAAASGHLALHEACFLFQDGVAALGPALARDAELRDGLLRPWPALVTQYLASTGDEPRCSALAEHLCRGEWPAPLSLEDAALLASFLQQGADEAAGAGQEPAPAETWGWDSPSTPSVDELAGETPPAPPAGVPVTEEVAGAVAEGLAAEVREDIVPAAMGEATHGAPTEERDVEPTAEVELGADPEVVAGPAAAEAMTETLAPSPAEPGPTGVLRPDEAAATELAELMGMQEALEDEADDDPRRSDEPEADALPGPVEADWDVFPEAVREILELLTSEADALPELLAEALAIASTAEAAAGERADALAHCAEQVERFGDALDAGGLAGLQRSCAFLQENVQRLAERGEPLTQAEAALPTAWSAAVARYLRTPGSAESCEALVRLLEDRGWPSPLEGAAADELLALLLAPELSAAVEPEGPARASEARPADVSLTVPEDVPAELAESLLQELPGQTAALSEAVQRLRGGSGTREDVNVAQRAAHTLKGAANTVGVVGVANLTHQMEDILLALAKHETLPGRQLSDVLVEACDCLEAMGDALAGAGAPPEDAVATLQRVLDWANLIDREGVAAVAGDAPAPAPAPARAAAPTAAPEEASAAPADAETAAAAMVRVPASLLDNLLRLVGETLLLTSQIHDRLNQVRHLSRSTRDQFALLQQLGYELEQIVDLRGIAAGRLYLVKDERFDPLELDQYNEMHTLSRRIVEAATDAREMGRQVEDVLGDIDARLIDQGHLNRDTHEAVLQTRMVAVKSVFPRLQRAVRQAARATDKSVDLVLDGAETLIDSEVLGQVVDPMVHVLRNAVDHGIESTGVRTARGKRAGGRIEASFGREGNQVVVRCRDDGGGLDLEAIRTRAVALGLLRADDAPPEEELKRLVLRPNFTTRSSATQVSGRGIGLDMVNRRVHELGGFLRIDSKPGEGCVVELRIPQTLLSAHALLVRVRRHLVALVERGIEQILHADEGEVRYLADQMVYQTRDDLFPATTLDALLGLPVDPRGRDRTPRTALLVQGVDGPQVVMVQDLIDSRDLVVKGLGRYMPKLRGIVGATILGDGTVTPVLDLPELLREPVVDVLETETQTLHVAAAEILPLALVVDDSLSARRSLARFMAESGYQVREARDGLEALEVLKGVKADVVLVDLEMPRMNGLELTTHLRARPETQHVPVIMVTSRSTLKHRQQAEAAGVNVYITKPFVEDDLLRHLERLGASA